MSQPPVCPPGTHLVTKHTCVPDVVPCPDLPADGRAQPLKNANKDANTWKVVPMRDDTTLFKVVDDKDVNVADQFHSQANAEQYVAHFKCTTIPPPCTPTPCPPNMYFDMEQCKCVEDTPPPPPPPSDDKIYPDTVPPHIFTNVTDGGIEQDGDRKEPQIAGYDFLNTEATAYVKVHGINDTLSIKLRGPKHSGIPDDDMCNNIHYINLGSENKNPFGKQSGHTKEYCDFGFYSVSIPDNVWVGCKAIEWNSSDGKSVHFQTWIQNPEGSQWKLAAEFVDDGSSTGCGGSDPRAGVPYTTSPCQGLDYPVSIGFRVDGLKAGGDVEFKNLSVREIQPPV